MTPLRIFIGTDTRIPLATTVLSASLVRHSSIPLAITPLMLDTLPMKRRGLTDFTWSRFLVPYLCGFQGPALFLDSDIICTRDIAELVAEVVDNPHFAVACVNTEPQFERAAVMLFNCGHPDNQRLTPEYIDATQEPLHLIRWTNPRPLTNRWNFLVGYDKQEWMKEEIPGLIHYTKGIPIWPETVNSAYASQWHDAQRYAIGCSVDFNGLMGGSVHVQPAGPGTKPEVPNAIRNSLGS